MNSFLTTQVNLDNIEAFKTLFNQDIDQLRLILLLSPTRSTSIAGARWIQQEILEKNPAADLRVYAVWEPILANDVPSKWDNSLITDPRVTHLWDAKKTVGKWFAEHVEGYSGIVWDIYYLYGPGARWQFIPSPLVSSGATIISQQEKLQTHLLFYLNGVYRLVYTLN